MDEHVMATSFDHIHLRPTFDTAFAELVWHAVVFCTTLFAWLGTSERCSCFVTGRRLKLEHIVVCKLIV